MQDLSGNSPWILFETETPYWYSMQNEHGFGFGEKIVIVRSVPITSPEYMAIACYNTAFLDVPFSFQLNRILGYDIHQSPPELLQISEIMHLQDSLSYFELEGPGGTYRMMAGGIEVLI
jgi:hypothetical protein